MKTAVCLRMPPTLLSRLDGRRRPLYVTRAIEYVLAHPDDERVRKRSSNEQCSTVITVKIASELHRALRELSQTTGVSASDYIREGLRVTM